MADLGATNVKNDRMSHLIDMSTKKTQLEHPFSGLSILSHSVFPFSIILTAFVNTLIPSQNNEKINNLTDMMRTLALSVRNL